LAELSDRVTLKPPPGAAALNRTEQVTVSAGSNVAGTHCNDVSEGTAEAVNVNEIDLEAPEYAAVMVTDAFAATLAVLTVKLAEVEPCATVTDPGVVTSAEESEIVTAAPPLGAGAFSVTEQMVEAPGATVMGLHVSDTSAGAGAGDSVIEALRDTPFKVAVTVRATVLGTAPAVTVKVPVEDPAAMTVEDGVVRYDPLSASATINPPDGAAPLNRTVQTDPPGPFSDAGLHASETNAGSAGDRVIEALRETPLRLAVTVRVTVFGTAAAVTVKVPVEDPAAITVEDGVVRYDPLSASATLNPPDGAAPLNRTVHVNDPAPLMEPAPHESEVNCGIAGTPGMVRALPVTGSAVPVDDAPTILLKLSAASEARGTAEIVATTPAGMAFLFTPTAIQVKAPVRLTHDSFLPEAVSAGPAAALTDVSAEAGYCSVHCNAAAPEG
jgi:hypothetical protein